MEFILVLDKTLNTLYDNIYSQFISLILAICYLQSHKNYAIYAYSFYFIQ